MTNRRHVHEYMLVFLIERNVIQDYASHLRNQDLPNLEMFVATSLDQAQPFVSGANIILGKPAFVTPLLDQAELPKKCSPAPWQSRVSQHDRNVHVPRRSHVKLRR